MPFYKKTDTELLTAPSFVHGPSFELDASIHDTYTYPVEGWYWYDTIDDALAGFSSNVARISARQARLMLLQRGLLDAVNNYIAAMPSSAAKIEWEYATEIARESPMVATLASALTLTPVDVDEMFAAAALL